MHTLQVIHHRRTGRLSAMLGGRLEIADSYVELRRWSAQPAVWATAKLHVRSLPNKRNLKGLRLTGSGQRYDLYFSDSAFAEASAALQPYMIKAV